MKKKMLSLVAAVLLAVGPAIGQIIIQEGDANHNRAYDQNAVSVMVPGELMDVDQWKHAPLGNGMLLLAGLGAAYALSKRKKD
jgi:hypothetical protein